MIVSRDNPSTNDTGLVMLAMKAFSEAGDVPFSDAKLVIHMLAYKPTTAVSDILTKAERVQFLRYLCDVEKRCSQSEIW